MGWGVDYVGPCPIFWRFARATQPQEGIVPCCSGTPADRLPACLLTSAPSTTWRANAIQQSTCIQGSLYTRPFLVKLKLSATIVVMLTN